MPTQKILLVQLYSNGDCLYATTIARQIKQDFPGCHLIWAISGWCKAIIANNPYVDEVLEVNSVAKNDAPAFRHFKKKVLQQKKEGFYDEVFIVHNTDTNHAYYDGCIRSSILKAYPHPITVPLQPVLQLLPQEIAKADIFSKEHNLDGYEHVILFEFAPQSGQSKMTPGIAISIAEAIVAVNNAAIILSSANKIAHPNKAIIDGSELTLRETAALSQHCSFLLGSSSGITWITTSQAGKMLPMVQLLDAKALWGNPVSRDFERFHIPTEKLLELTDFDEDKIIKCTCLALTDFSSAKRIYDQPVPYDFRTTRNIVYNLLCYLEFGAILKHIQVTRQVYGHRMLFYKELLMGFLTTPFRLIKNKLRKMK